MDPKKSKAWKQMAAVEMLRQRNQQGVYRPHDGPIQVTVKARWKRPKRWTLSPDGDVMRICRPDGDNCLKSCLDSGNKVLWDDDSLVVRAIVEKWWAPRGEEGSVEIEVEAVAGVYYGATQKISGDITDVDEVAGWEEPK